MVKIVSDEKSSQTSTLSLIVVKKQNQTKTFPKRQYHMANTKPINNKKPTAGQEHILFFATILFVL